MSVGEVLREMGPLAAIIFIRIVNLKILSGLQVEGAPINFLEPVLKYYWDCSSRPDPESIRKLEKVLSVIPPIRELKIAIKSKLPKENLVYKIVIDILGFHLKGQASQYKV